MSPLLQQNLLSTRRHFFGRSASGIGTAALASLLRVDGLAAHPDPLASHFPNFAPKAKHVIYLFQNGAPSHVDLFDHKPELAKNHGKEIPDSFIAGKRFSTMTGNPKGKPLLGHIEPFHQHGQSGAWVSDLLPHTAAIADELCFLKGMHTQAVNHAPGISLFLSGEQMPGRPSMGAWLSYGLGSPSADLPAFVVMTSISEGATCGQIFYDFYWGAGFLPSRHQGVRFRGQGDPVLYLSDPPGISRSLKRSLLDDIAAVNDLKLADFGDPEIATRIAQYEMAYRMQSSVPDLTDLSDEPPHVIEMYGPQCLVKGTYAHHCLMARRLVERGVRFVQVMHAGWDQHNSITTEFYKQCEDTDQPSAALVKDLKQRGLLDDTLVIWGGEFGRTPFLQGDINNRPRWGRDHHPYAFTKWLAGGGIKPGISYGQSDELGMSVVDGAVHVHDLQATILHQLGIDHTRLTFRHQGRHFRLTDVHGHVVEPVLA
jgi:hypothetical protein